MSIQNDAGMDMKSACDMLPELWAWFHPPNQGVRGEKKGEKL